MLGRVLLRMAKNKKKIIVKLPAKAKKLPKKGSMMIEASELNTHNYLVSKEHSGTGKLCEVLKRPDSVQVRAVFQEPDQTNYTVVFNFKPRTKVRVRRRVAP